MGFKLLVPDESHSTIRAFEFDALVELSHRDDVLLFEDLVVRLY